MPRPRRRRRRLPNIRHGRRQGLRRQRRFALGLLGGLRGHPRVGMIRMRERLALRPIRFGCRCRQVTREEFVPVFGAVGGIFFVEAVVVVAVVVAVGVAAGVGGDGGAHAVGTGHGRRHEVHLAGFGHHEGRDGVPAATFAGMFSGVSHGRRGLRLGVLLLLLLLLLLTLRRRQGLGGMGRRRGHLTMDRRRVGGVGAPGHGADFFESGGLWDRCHGGCSHGRPSRRRRML
mmetsp:Transcript_3763/g.8079  ORF Transcript_3763/g.8079 Transcript_3763/m.8079 type:complete len:231 (-) Transcript_3763:79-771(-)